MKAKKLLGLKGREFYFEGYIFHQLGRQLVFLRGNGIEIVVFT